jgi:hypothetical protein
MQALIGFGSVASHSARISSRFRLRLSILSVSFCCMLRSIDVAPLLPAATGVSAHVWDLTCPLLLARLVTVLSPCALSWSDPGFLRTRRSLSERPRLSTSSTALFLSAIPRQPRSCSSAFFAMMGDPGVALLSAPYNEQTISNFVEHSEQAKGNVSEGAKYIVDGSE